MVTRKCIRCPTTRKKTLYFPTFPTLKEKTRKSPFWIHLLIPHYSITRVSIQMANLGTNEIEVLLNDLTPKVDSIFPKKDYEVHITGTSVVFLKGTDYLVKNLFWSLALAIVIITILMAFIFSSFTDDFNIADPQLIPQLMTAGMMGYFGISIKPSTILIFSIALGYQC